MARHQRRANDSGLTAVVIEGGLISPAQLAVIAATPPDLKAAADYNCPKGTNLRDEITRYFRIAQAHWQAYSRIENPNVIQTANFARAILEGAFGFEPLTGPHRHTLDDHTYRIAWDGKGGRVPVVVAAPLSNGDAFNKSLPELGDEGTGTIARRSPVVLLQDWLNANDQAMWGLCFAGDRVRLMRDNASLTRQSYIEADLGAIFKDEIFSDFTALWLLIHATRFGAEGTPANDCHLERWREAGMQAGTTARQRLGQNVADALLALGQGVLDANPDLRGRLDDNSLSLKVLFEQILRVVYRLIFLAVAEDRDLLHPRATVMALRNLYKSSYSFDSVRERAARRSSRDHHSDAWEGMLVTFKALEHGEKQLGLPALGGLFSSTLTPDLNNARLPNKAFLIAILRLSFLIDTGRSGAQRVRINWRDMATEELGSVYEGLLELVPIREDHGRKFGFAGGDEQKGNTRKTSSSYYTPDSLVQALLDASLDPVLAQAEAEGGADGILKLTVIDPACGSGHFLLGAARRMATRVAQLRNPDAPDYNAAMRDVVRSSIYGVDRNPMAVELSKVALWIETVEPGKPLGFLDANIRCGDSLLGVFDLSVLEKGIPDEAYNALRTDDKEACRILTKVNRNQRDEKWADLSGYFTPEKVARTARQLHDMAEDNPPQLKAKRDAFVSLRTGKDWWSRKIACDLYLSAFLRPKRFRETAGYQAKAPDLVPTTHDVKTALAGGQGNPQMIGLAVELASDVYAFHWPLEFPDIFAEGGFDVVLGNPPWDTMSPDYKEFFSAHDPNIRHMSPEEQKAAYARLLSNPVLAELWDKHCADLYAAVHFIKSSGRYRLFAEGNLGKGDFNVYRMFVETALAATKKGKVAAQFVPEGLYNGANATAIRREFFTSFRLEHLAGFENTKGIWFDKIDTRMKFCLYVAWKDGKTEAFNAAFRVNSREKLQEFKNGSGLRIPVSIVEEFSPDAVAVMEFAAQSEIDICSRMYALYPKFGVEIEGLPYRHYMREVDMGTDRDLFSEGNDGLPVFEGRMIDAYDYRAKGYVSGRGRSAVWTDMPFGSGDKCIQPQWRITENSIPEKLGDRVYRYRIGFGDVASPTNQRALVAALLPKSTASGHKVPTIEFFNGSIRDSLVWLGVANSLVMDFLVRKKVSLTMSYTIMDSLPFPRDFERTPSAIAISQRVCSLCAVGNEMEAFRAKAVDAGILSSADQVIEAPDQRAVVATEIDVLVARDVFGLSKHEMLYILDPDNILGADSGVETFKALRNAELREFKEYRTQRLVLEAWDRLEAQV